MTLPAWWDRQETLCLLMVAISCQIKMFFSSCWLKLGLNQ